MKLSQFNRIVEIRTKIISMGTFISASLYTAAYQNSFSFLRFTLLAFAVLFVDMGTTGFNSYFDYISGTDRKDLNLERDKVLVHEGVPARIALLISSTLFAAAGAIGLILAYMTSWYLLLIGGFCMLVGFLYTGGPLPISRTPFGELFAGGFLGSILFLITNFVLSLSVTLEVAFASLPFLLLVGLILTVNNTCDIKADTVAGRRTLSIVLGPERSVTLMRFIITISYLLTAAFSLSGIYPIYTIGWALPAFYLTIRTFGSMTRRGFSLETKGISMGGVSKVFLLFVCAFCAGMATHLLLR
jgi:1,4-dihydroxy-2-naphthoate octaprenyltransferase